jgi:hypothetical protein
VKIIREAMRSGDEFLSIFVGSESARVGPLHDGDPVDVIFNIEEAPKGGPPSRRMQKHVRDSERQIGKDIGGRAQPASGALPGMKGDARARGRHRVESKTTKNISYAVSRRDLNKIRSECTGAEKPAFVVEFVNPKTLREEDKWVLIPYEDWHEAYVDQAPGKRGG